MLAANNSIGHSSQPPPPPPPSAPPQNAPTLLTVNGIIPTQTMNFQTLNRQGPVLTPAFLPNTTFTSFPIPFSGPSSVFPCITSPTSGAIFQGPGATFPFNMAGSMLVAQPQQVISGTPVSFPSFNSSGNIPNSSPPSTATIVFTTNDMCFTSTAPLAVIQNFATPITSSTAAPVISTFNPGMMESTPPIKCKPEVKPVIPTSSLMNLEANIASLEKHDFHRGLILDAIDKLRERKARPDLERISCLLRRQHNISPTETQVCLTRLAENGSVVCVDYKGNLSYRNPSKWRKTANSVISNRPNVSMRLVDAIHLLIPEGATEAPHGFTLFQIEQALKELQPPTPGTSESEEQSTTVTPELTGATLRVCLDREASFGRLAKLSDGRYVLDENGEKKRTIAPPFTFSRKPYLGKLATTGPFGKPPIAPALESANGKSVLPIGAGRTLARRPPFPTSGKRGRPPTIKSKKMLAPCPQLPILPAPAPDGGLSLVDKRLKLEPMPQTTFVPLDGTVMVPTLSLPPVSQHTSNGPPPSMIMYPSLYNPTVFTMAPEPTLVAAFQPEPGPQNILVPTVPTPEISMTSSFVEPVESTETGAKKVGKETDSKPMIDGCCRCQKPATEDDKFLVCVNCGLQGAESTYEQIRYENNRRLLSLSERAQNNPVMAIFDHIMILTQRGFVINHSTKNNHQRCLVCLHALLLKKRVSLPSGSKTDSYFLSWYNSNKSETGFRMRPLSYNALSIIVRNIQSTLWSVLQHLRTGADPRSLDLWQLFIQSQEQVTAINYSRHISKSEEGPLDLSIRGKAHPKCLEFWPEVTERARQEAWQCADCKSCSVCKNKSEMAVLICDACDKGFHAVCHQPPVPEDTDQTAPWICQACQEDGIQVRAVNFSALESNTIQGNTPLENGHGNSIVMLNDVDSVTTASPAKSSLEEGFQSGHQNKTVKRGAATAPSTPLKGNAEVVTSAPVKSASTPTWAPIATPAAEELEDRPLPPNLGSPNHAVVASPQTDGQPSVMAPLPPPRPPTAPPTRPPNQRPAEVKNWSVSQVSDWLLDQGNFVKEAEAFRQQDIDGACLMLLKRMSVLTDVGIKLGPAVKIFDRIKRLHSAAAAAAAADSNGQMEPENAN